MPIPDYQTLMLPALKALGGGAERRPRDVVDELAEKLNLTPAERGELLGSIGGLAA